MRETIRVSAENAETFFLEVIFEQRRGTRATLVRAILYLLSKVYAVAGKIRRFVH